MEWIDLRSDTVTEPTPEMREAMANAELGDDVYGEDPTVNHLQELSAQMLGKEAALFVPSGTMGNLAAILAHCARGDEIIIGDHSHTYLYEAGGVSALGGIHTFVVKNRDDGTVPHDEIEAAIRSDNDHFPITSLICLENTHNRCGGSVLSVDYIQDVGRIAEEHGLRMHIDGARIFNAAIALGVSPAELVAPAASVTFCLSKGLCAPAGSVICGDEAFIQKVHRARKMLGGGMRQAGVLAAAGVVALETMVDRLSEDHIKARRLAETLAALPGLSLDYETPATNMIFLRLDVETPIEGEELVRRFADKGIKISASRAGQIRLVIHYWVDDGALAQVTEAFKELFLHA
ncbi:MAG: low-specificity L-threonine aldolase [Anaerolineales bacterium]|nr:MAG: low-specificity L-threonine aldolase [Anaerolineales bacterium]